MMGEKPNKDAEVSSVRKMLWHINQYGIVGVIRNRNLYCRPVWLWLALRRVYFWLDRARSAQALEAECGAWDDRKKVILHAWVNPNREYSKDWLEAAVAHGNLFVVTGRQRADHITTSVSDISVSPGADA